MEKPVVQLTGVDCNIFSIIGRAAMALKSAGQSDQANKMWERVQASDNYQEALSIIIEYVDWE
ncbi:hypothetical protein NDK43_25840 [Neobacillus pocheonensis]|uniref:Tetratricopeptide repeat protein n=1 Tax=Neobacillus pocheonensis TaxID=363869 RepID=A0ABT0WFQ7_9BACI|nr:hypothetical protein [Neobacillus pocheonensis]